MSRVRIVIRTIRICNNNVFDLEFRVMAGVSILQPRPWTQRGAVAVAIVVMHLGIVAMALISKARKVQPAEAQVMALMLLDDTSHLATPTLPQVALRQPASVSVKVPEVQIDMQQVPVQAVTASTAVAATSVAVLAASRSSRSISPEVVSDIEYARVTPAAYPVTAVRQRIEDIVYVRVIVDEGGRVAFAVVHSSGGFAMLDDAALQAVRNWLFRPYVRNGVAMQVAVIVPVKFSLRVRTARG
jgi:periplasmic protein TonB